MGETEGDDVQNLKRAAAAAYDYENDSRWAAYWSNVLIPPHMASRPDVIDHYKRKFYSRYIDSELVVEPMSLPSASQTANPSGQSSSTSTNGNTRPRDAAPRRSSTQPERSSTQPERSTNPLQLDKRTIRFSINAWVLVVAVLGILPFSPKSLSSKAYQLSMLGTILSASYAIYIAHGKPRGWNLPALQAWAQPVLSSKESIHLMFCIMLVSAQLQFKIALIPVLCWSVDHIARFLRRNFSNSSLYRRYLEEPCIWVETNASTLNMLCTNAEIALGFLLIISFFTWQRSIIQAFIYWNLLKLMYRAPQTCSYHQNAWANVGRTTDPYIRRYAPFLSSGVPLIQRWWFS